MDNTTVALVARWWCELGLYDTGLDIEVELES
jgi:hypothetical protein